MTDATDIEFLDTNVVLYAHDTTAGPKYESAKALVARLSRSGGAVSIQVLQEFFVNATQKLPTALSPATAAAVVTDLSSLSVHRPSPSDVQAAIEIHEGYGLSFWDAMIVRSAAQLGCEILWSEDLNAGQVYEGVEVRNPFD